MFTIYVLAINIIVATVMQNKWYIIGILNNNIYKALKIIRL